MTDPYDGLTLLGHPTAAPVTPAAAKLERVPNPTGAADYLVRFACPGVHLALPADRPAGFRPSRHRLCPRRHGSWRASR